MVAAAAFAFAVLAMMATATAGEDRRNEAGAKPTAPAPASYVVAGDSYSRGTGATDLNGFAWLYRERAEDNLGRPIRLDQEAVGGYTSTELLSHLRSTPEAREALADADIVTVYVGYNDLHRARSAYKSGGCGGEGGQRCYRRMMRRFEQSYPKLLDLALDAASDDAVVLTGTIPYPDIRRDRRSSAVGRRPDARVHAAFVGRLDRRIKEVAAARVVPVADVHQRFNGASGQASPIRRGLIAPDRIHPNDRGHQVIAELFGALSHPEPTRRSES